MSSALYTPYSIIRHLFKFDDGLLSFHQLTMDSNSTDTDTMAKGAKQGERQRTFSHKVRTGCVTWYKSPRSNRQGSDG